MIRAALGARGAQGLMPYPNIALSPKPYSSMIVTSLGAYAPNSYARPGSYLHRGAIPIPGPSSWGVSPANPSIH